MSSVYNPTIGGLVEQAEKDWTHTRNNRHKLIRYMTGVEFDKAMWGVNTIDGELIVIQARKKKRKSTLLANWAIHFTHQLPNLGYWMCIDTLESGMTPKAYRDVLVAIMASRIMIATALDNPNRETWPNFKQILAHELLAPNLHLSRKFLQSGDRTEFQYTAINKAIEVLSDKPMTIFGGAKNQGNTRSLEEAIKRWDLLYKGEYKTEQYDLSGKQHRIFAVDNVQQYREYASNSYYGLEAITNAISDFISTHPGAVIFAVSQVSLGSVRLAQSGVGEMEARGGTRLAEEAVTVFQTEYDKDTTPWYITIHTADSRYEPPPTVKQEIEPYSGTFLRPSEPIFRSD